MRTSPLLAVAAVLAVTTFGCSDEETGSGLQGRRSPRHTTAAGLDDEHDETDTQGSTASDPGNPNADRAPSAPTTPGSNAAEFGLTLGSTTPTVDLGGSTDIDVTVEPKAGFTGPVELSVSGLPAGATAAPVTANVGTGPTTAKLTIKADYTAVVTAPDQAVPLVVTAKANAAQATANANFKIAPKVKITIPINVDALRGATQLRADYGEAFGPNTQSLKTQPNNGIVVTIFNADSKQHIIHGPGGSFPHGNIAAPIQPNSFEMNNGEVRTRTLNVGASATAYLHDGQNGQGASFRIQVANGN